MSVCQAALDALLRGDVRQLPEDSSDSEDDTGEPTAAGRPVNPKEDPSNVEGLRSLWVGNIMQSVTERDIRDLFARLVGGPGCWGGAVFAGEPYC